MDNLEEIKNLLNMYIWNKETVKRLYLMYEIIYLDGWIDGYNDAWKDTKPNTKI